MFEHLKMFFYVTYCTAKTRKSFCAKFGVEVQEYSNKNDATSLFHIFKI
jgi:hypothetical protein